MTFEKTEQEKQTMLEELKQCKENLKLLQEKGNNVSVSRRGTNTRLLTGCCVQEESDFITAHHASVFVVSCHAANSASLLVMLNIYFIPSELVIGWLPDFYFQDAGNDP